MSERATLSAPAAAQAALASRPAAVPGRTTVVVPPVAWSKEGQLRLSAKAVKASIVIDPTVLVGLEVPVGKAHTLFEIAVNGIRVPGQFNSKSLRRAVAVVAQQGAEGVVAVAQGKLDRGDKLEEAGIIVQPKKAKDANGGDGSGQTEG